jgi:hypothetical protein
VRNFALAGAIALAVWYGIQPVAWTTDQALRRLEREMLLSPGKTQYHDGDGWGEAVFVLGDTYAYTAKVRNRDFGRSLVGKQATITQAVSLEGEISLLPLVGQSLETGLCWNGKFFCPQGPGGASMARLTLICQYRLTTKTEFGVEQRQEEQSGTLEFYSEAEAGEVGVYDFSVKAENERQAMILCQLLGGWGRNRGEDGVWRQTCVLTKVDYRLDFYGEEGTPRGQTQGELDLSYQVGG